MTDKQYEICVIGGGHAGIEAASATARMGHKTALITFDASAIGRLSCNPAIGGMAKGQLVCEIDALGGEMGRLADRSGIQFKTLGTRKGPAMWSPRSQNDKDLYPQFAQERIAEIAGLTVIEAGVEDITVSDGRIQAVILNDGTQLVCKALIVCAGTFLSGRMYTGLQGTPGGRMGEKSAEQLSGSLTSIGFETGRLKTGTPPRLDRHSIDFAQCTTDQGDANPRPFSSRTTSVRNQITCYTTWSNPRTHAIIGQNLDSSPMFSGAIAGIGPRYCPSIEDKIFRFADKDGHMLFLEPEGLHTDSVYVNGFSTSLPEDVQIQALHTIPGLEECRILRKGYAVEYDYLPPYQLHANLMSRTIEGLFFAGQVNGTSGYEEAAAQGLIAGINAALYLEERPSFVPDRSEAYIGVLLDDLSTLSTLEPYRMFTSRAEYRLHLRRDNADTRLSHYAHDLGLISTGEWARVESKIDLTERAKSELNRMRGEVTLPDETVAVDSYWSLLKRPDVSFEQIRVHKETKESVPFLKILEQRNDVIEQIEILARYEGYVARQLKEIEAFRKREEEVIPENIDYERIRSISSEGREKLMKFRPRSLGHASRISGISRSDLNVLMLYIR